MTVFMNLNLPVPTQTIGPDWANELNSSLEVIDAHDHSSGKGVKIKTNGLSIDADLSLNTNSLIDIVSSKYTNQSSTLTGATNANSLYVSSGNLYFTNNAGAAIQITSGGSIASIPASLETVETQIVSANLTISPADSFVYLFIDTNAPRTINLPLASAVATGRIYIIKDRDGLASTNPITVNAAGADNIDGDSSIQITSERSTTWVIGNGANSWAIS